MHAGDDLSASGQVIQLPLLDEVDLAEAAAPGRDRVPELTHYTDDGCRAHPTCLDCPFPLCIYEEPRGPRHALNVERNEQIRRLYAAGESPQAIAAQFGVVPRTIYRVIGGIRTRAEREAVGDVLRTRQS